jgi:hypothetical protein
MAIVGTGVAGDGSAPQMAMPIGTLAAIKSVGSSSSTYADPLREPRIFLVSSMQPESVAVWSLGHSFSTWLSHLPPAHPQK